MAKANIFWLGAALVIALSLLAAPAAFAQGCTMCRTGAEASADGGKSLNLAIIVLLVPTLSLFVGIVVFGLRRADAESAAAEQPNPGPAADRPRAKGFARAVLLLRPHAPSKN
jgi:hypothetical protein